MEGYPIVALSRNGTTSKLPVHRWVALAFLGPHPPGQQVRHLDGDPTHNAPGNLRYGTASQNARDSVGHGTHVQARKEECAQGHRLTAGNVYQWRGRRKCRTCRARRSAERYLAEKRARAHASP